MPTREREVLVCLGPRFSAFCNFEWQLPDSRAAHFCQWLTRMVSPFQEIILMHGNMKCQQFSSATNSIQCIALMCD